MAAEMTTAHIDIDTSSSDDDNFGGDEYDNKTHIPLDSIKSFLKTNLNIRYNYTNWEPREAFRELVQNWRDEIIKSSRLAERDFRVKPREETTSGRNTEIVYNAVVVDADGVEKCLGYIRFKGRDGEGTVDIVNASATLEPRHLTLGFTSKTNQEHQAGAFGEGLKLALVVLMRGEQNHHVQCRSGGFTWSFNFDKDGLLIVYLRRMSPKHISRVSEQLSRQFNRPQSLLPIVSRPEEDVHFVIGQRLKGTSEHGEQVKRNFVTQTQFDAWTEAALFLQNNAGEEAIIHTLYDGDLLRAPQFQGKMYLKGLLLDESTASRSASKTTFPLRFGYNFAYGRTDRERKTVLSADEEARAMLAIWEAALTLRPDLIAELSNMLNSSEPKYADVAGARRYMTKKTASLLKDYLRGGDRAGNWYYSDTEKNKNPRLDHIIRGLGYTGVKLTQTYWDLLSRRGLIRTAEEEERVLFTSAPRVPVPKTGFGGRLCLLLSACLRACPQTNDMGFGFVHAGRLNLQLSFSDDDYAFRINDRWLSVEGAAVELCLRGSLAEARVLYHACKSLFSEALEQLPLELFVNKDENPASTPPERLRKLEISLAEQRLLNYLRIEHPTVEPVAGRPELRVTWPVDPQWDTGTEIEIQCHRASTCSSLRDNLQIAYHDLGPELLELDILGISRWHVAKSFGSITDDVVIGIRNEDAVAQLAEIRKRRRM
ncbi:hypothetical protein SEUCBS140593_000816 [Sporothrix eucalyptigena]|uniref:Uncharacterized protein n=1 Tax=Sporothrix eucalyptigena TaxID=1812306 RepID=A0ABP0AT20_9PEZI